MSLWMSLWQYRDAISPSLPEHCFPQSEALNRFSAAFHVCVPTNLAAISTVLGCLSILSWLFAQLPQIVKNYNIQSTAGLSIFFLAEWCLGDATNLVGAVLTGQATWQIIVASYYLFVDVVLVCQYIWYTKYRPWQESKLQNEGNLNGKGNNGNSGPFSSASAQGYQQLQGEESNRLEGEVKPSKPREAPFNNFRFPSLSSSPREKGSYQQSNLVCRSASPPPFSPKAVLFISMLCFVLSHASPIRRSQSTSTLANDDSKFVGRLLSWVSTFLYLVSRLPQLYKNHKRRSTAGLSLSLFIAAFFGNLFYSTSILTNPLAWGSYPPYGAHGWAPSTGSDREKWIALAAPFWLGAAGVLALDGAVGVQFWIFGEEGVEKRVKVRYERGRSHWRKVSGWMRGWVPSPSPRRRVEVEDERPLLERDAPLYGGT